MSLFQRPRRQMARRVREPRRLGGAPLAVVGLAVSALVIGGLALALGGGRPVVASLPSPSGRPPIAVLPSSNAAPTPAPTTRASAPPSSRPSTRPSPTPRPSPAESVAARRSPAPRSEAQFDRTGQVIEIAFPIRPEIEYRYRDNWLDRRAGPADPYNHARVADDGRLLRLHDGIDIYGPEGAPVVAPFAGRIIDPSQRWTPWEPDRYGLTVVIESTEEASAGYTAMLVHLEQVWVDIGQKVSRGQVIGVLGRTGNAENVRPQLHFELRAPFDIDWSTLGENRRVDAFNPYPSLIRADPHL